MSQHPNPPFHPIYAYRAPPSEPPVLENLFLKYGVALTNTALPTPALPLPAQTDPYIHPSRQVQTKIYPPTQSQQDRRDRTRRSRSRSQDRYRCRSRSRSRRRQRSRDRTRGRRSTSRDRRRHSRGKSPSPTWDRNRYRATHSNQHSQTRSYKQLQPQTHLAHHTQAREQKHEQTLESTVLRSWNQSNWNQIVIFDFPKDYRIYDELGTRSTTVVHGFLEKYEPPSQSSAHWIYPIRYSFPTFRTTTSSLCVRFQSQSTYTSRWIAPRSSGRNPTQAPILSQSNVVLSTLAWWDWCSTEEHWSAMFFHLAEWMSPQATWILFWKENVPQDTFKPRDSCPPSLVEKLCETYRFDLVKRQSISDSVCVFELQRAAPQKQK